jgi:hypothetical protein
MKKKNKAKILLLHVCVEKNYLTFVGWRHLPANDDKQI